MRTNAELEAVADKIDNGGRPLTEEVLYEALRGLTQEEQDAVRAISLRRLEETNDRISRLGAADAALVEHALTYFNPPSGRKER